MHQWVAISVPLDFFSLCTFYVLISQLSHILKFIHPHNWFNNSSIHIIFPSHFLLFISLSSIHTHTHTHTLSLSLSLSLICSCARGKSSQKKPQLSRQIITNLLLFGLLWFFLNTYIVNLFFFFFE